MDDCSSSSASGPAWSLAVSGSASKTKLGASSSVVLAVIVAWTLAYSVGPATVCVIVALSPVPSVSSAAVRVTVWGVFQFVDVNVRVFWTPLLLSPSVSSTVTAVVSSLAIVTVASWVGSEDRRTV